MPKGDAEVMCDVSVFKTSTLEVSESEPDPLASDLQVVSKLDIRAMQHCSLRYLDIFYFDGRNIYLFIVSFGVRPKCG